MKIIGVDIGGSKISTGLVSEGKIIRESTLATPFDRPQYEVVQAVIQAIEEVFDPGINGIGIGVPGLVDLEEQTVLDVINIPSWNSVPLKELISEYFNKPVEVNNDANCFALGEKYYGKGNPMPILSGSPSGPVWEPGSSSTTISIPAGFAGLESSETFTTATKTSKLSPAASFSATRASTGNCFSGGPPLVTRWH